MSYKKAAIKAARLAKTENINPAEAWEMAVHQVYPDSINNQEKACPKNAFLGLCEEGLINGIPSGNYTRSEWNKKYAVAAVSILQEWKHSKLSPLDLWPAVLKKLKADIKKQHNSQMNVVLALWDKGLIN